MPAMLSKGAMIVTMDDQLGDFARADLLIEGSRIAAVGPDLASEGAERIDARGRIIVPGLVNAHMHTCPTGLRSLVSNWTLLEYFRNVHRGLATLLTPEDLYHAELLGGWNQIDCGTTMLGDRSLGPTVPLPSWRRTLLDRDLQERSVRAGAPRRRRRVLPRAVALQVGLADAQRRWRRPVGADNLDEELREPHAGGERAGDEVLEVELRARTTSAMACSRLALDAGWTALTFVVPQAAPVSGFLPQ
jgi:cytosine/adenosine deaminase-related metal-dependent hydrolase